MEREHKPRTSMILLLEHVHAMDELTDEEFGQFIRAYADYVENGIEPGFPDRSMRMMWKTIKSFDEANQHKYSLTVEARRDAGRKGAEKRWNQDSKAMDANSKNSKCHNANGKNIEKKNGDAIKRFKAPTIEQAKVVFIDYLQLIHQAGAKDRYSAVTEISMALHEFAQSTGTLVVALAQLNRETARAGIPPTAADLRESGQIEQDADAIILLAQKVKTQKRPEEHYHFALEKNKEGNVGSLDITFQMETQQFKECVWM